MALTRLEDERAVRLGARYLVVMVVTTQDELKPAKKQGGARGWDSSRWVRCQQPMGGA